MEKPFLVVRRQRDDQRPFRPQFYVHAGCLLQLRGEGRPARLTLASECNQCFFAWLSFRAGRQHARGSMAGTGTSCAAIEHRNRCIAYCQTPSDAQTDHSGADDDDLGLAGID